MNHAKQSKTCILLYERVYKDLPEDEVLKKEVYQRSLVLLAKLFDVKRISAISSSAWRSQKGKEVGMKKLIEAGNEAQALYLKWRQGIFQSHSARWVSFVKMAKKAIAFEKLSRAKQENHPRRLSALGGVAEIPAISTIPNLNLTYLVYRIYNRKYENNDKYQG